MNFRLPEALTTTDDTTALNLLHSYYGSPFGSDGALAGAAFDTWDSTGTRSADANRFTADDLVACSFLSVRPKSSVPRALLRDRADEFSRLLAELGPDRDLADEPEPLHDDWPGWSLMAALKTVADVDTTTASKLLARKRPRLRPIWDPVIAEVTGSRARLWEPLRVALRQDDLALHHRLLRLRDKAGLPAAVSAIRVFDVIAWREGKARVAAGRLAVRPPTIDAPS